MLCGRLPIVASLRGFLLLQINSVSPIHLVKVHMQLKTAHMFSELRVEMGAVSVWEDSVVYRIQTLQATTLIQAPPYLWHTSLQLALHECGILVKSSQMRDGKAVIIWAMITIVPLTSVSYWSLLGKKVNTVAWVREEKVQRWLMQCIKSVQVLYSVHLKKWHYDTSEL